MKSYLLDKKKFIMAVDLDKTLCELRRSDQKYIDVVPLPGAIETMKFFKDQGFYILIYTARGMVSLSGDIEQIRKERLPDIEKWLSMHGIPYDDIEIGKAHYDVLLDDKSVRFEAWDQTTKEKILQIKREYDGL